MALIGVRELSWGFQNPPLLEHISFQIEKGERVCLLGRNGTGKSTLLKLLIGEIFPDSGEVWRQQGLTVAALDQVVPQELEGTIFEVVTAGRNPRGPVLTRNPPDRDDFVQDPARPGCALCRSFHRDETTDPVCPGPGRGAGHPVAG